MFTSGSTGVPKGVLLEHKAVSTSCLGHGKEFRFGPHIRALQFSAYTFDVSMTDIITTLIFGGTVCIPSDDDRFDNLTTAINTMGVNWALLTPTVARLLDPKDIQSLQTLALAGEGVSLDDWNRWKGHVQLINAYGPTECCIICTSYSGVQDFESGTIGKSIASVSWVVDLEDYNKLMPVGSVGELLVEGPILARGYLNDAEKTKDSFISDPAWLLEGGGDFPGRKGRMYKTGDLVRYRPDGNLICLGRKDGQVKIRGQRVELGEVEHHIRSYMPEAQQIVVEAIAPAGKGDNTTLAAFLQLSGNAHNLLSTNKMENGSQVQAILDRITACESDRAISRVTGAIRNTVAKLRLSSEFWGVPYPPRCVRIGRPSILRQAQREDLQAYLNSSPSAYMDEMKDFLYDDYDVGISLASVYRELEKMGWSRKLATKRAKEQSEPLRRLYLARMAQYYKAEQIVALDESACNERTGDRKYGWTPIGRDGNYQAKLAYSKLLTS
ncbi:EntF Non-ribosomal peptide synthetase module protein [Pyrenophora tritici-repentis]|nr:EntF Non-ribosomal peptide synthetase module protein [Pyrenophora tritici-repentis]